MQLLKPAWLTQKGKDNFPITKKPQTLLSFFLFKYTPVKTIVVTCSLSSGLRIYKFILLEKSFRLVFKIAF